MQAPELTSDVLLRARSGDRSAFRLVIDSLAPLAYNIAWRMCSNAPDAEDMTQEIFLRLHRHFGKYDPRYPFLPWFRTLSTNVCLTWRKKDWSAKAPSIDAMEDPQIAAPEIPAPPESSAILKAAMKDLQPEYRMVLAKLYLEGLSVADIAAAMGVPSGTIKTWLFRARDQLKNKLKPHVEKLS